MIKKETGRDTSRFKISFELELDVAGKWKFHGRRRRRATEIFVIRRQLYRAVASVMRFKMVEIWGRGGAREYLRERDGEKGKERRQRQEVSVLRPCGIRPPLRAYDSRKSLRLGIAPPRSPESTCRPLLRVGGRNWWRTRLERDYRLRPLLGANILLSPTGYRCLRFAVGRVSEFVEYACGFTLRLICSIILRRTSGNNCVQTPVIYRTWQREKCIKKRKRRRNKDNLSQFMSGKLSGRNNIYY